MNEWTVKEMTGTVHATISVDKSGEAVPVTVSKMLESLVQAGDLPANGVRMTNLTVSSPVGDHVMVSVDYTVDLAQLEGRPRIRWM